MGELEGRVTWDSYLDNRSPWWRRAPELLLHRLQDGSAGLGPGSLWKAPGSSEWWARCHCTLGKLVKETLNLLQLCSIIVVLNSFTFSIWGVPCSTLFPDVQRSITYPKNLDLQKMPNLASIFIPSKCFIEHFLYLGSSKKTFSSWKSYLKLVISAFCYEDWPNDIFQTASLPAYLW